MHPYLNMADSYQCKSWLHTHWKCFFSLINYSSVTTFIFFVFYRRNVNHLLSISFSFAFLKSNRSSLSALSPRRVNRGKWKRDWSYFLPVNWTHIWFILINERKRREVLETEISFLFAIEGKTRNVFFFFSSNTKRRSRQMCLI